MLLLLVVWVGTAVFGPALIRRYVKMTPLSERRIHEAYYEEERVAALIEAGAVKLEPIWQGAQSRVELRRVSCSMPLVLDVEVVYHGYIQSCLLLTGRFLLTPWRIYLLSERGVGSGGLAAEPTAENSVPVSARIEYCESDGNAFRLERNYRYRGPAVTSYGLNWQFDENAEEKEIEISAAAWIRFREALKKAGCDRWVEQKFDDQKVKTFWTLRVDYIDVKIQAAAPDSLTLRQDFAPIRKAIYDLTGGKVFCRVDMPERTESDKTSVPTPVNSAPDVGAPLPGGAPP